MAPYSALDGKPAWNSDYDLLTFQVFRDALLAILTIFLVRYVYNNFFSSTSSNSTTITSTSTTESETSLPPNLTIPDIIRTTCQNHITSALSTLKQHDVHPHRGFLPSSDPSIRLTDPRCKEWESVGTTLPDLLSAGQCRSTIRQMQLVDDWALAIGESREQQRRALLLLSAMANAYLWCDPDLILDVIPKNISIFCSVI